MTKSAYIHIPFCKQKCNYCSFISFPVPEMIDSYLSALCKEIKHLYNNELLNTLYFGGGTPSLLSPEEFKNIIGLFNLSENAEVTGELNPENLDCEYLKKLKSAGINRLSIGCQTFDDNILKLIGRKHSGDKVKDVVKLAQDIGFDNISLDFIYGLPEQSVKMFENDLITAINLGVQHISLYGLKIEKGCYFYSHYPNNLPDDDTQAEMYLKAINTLCTNGFEHYEISNFSKKNYSSKHNLNYWNNENYYGFGVAAHGYIDNQRYSNPISLKDYINNPVVYKELKTLTIQEQLEEEIFLGFRKLQGINTELINKKFKIDFELKYKSVLDKYISTNHLEKTENGYKFTNTGILVSNYILADFLED